MRRRPLALVCLALVMILSLAGKVRGAGRCALLTDLGEHLMKAAEAIPTMTLTCTVADVNPVSEGVRLSVDHIQIDTKDKSKEFLSPEIKFLLTLKTVNAPALSGQPESKMQNRHTPDYLPGDRLRVTGTFYVFSEATNPGEFDARQYYFSKDTLGRIVDPSPTLLSEGRESPRRFLARLRGMLQDSYFRILDEKTAKAIIAISLGQKSLMDSEEKQLFQEGGIAHMICVSGLHISLIGMGLYMLLRRLLLPAAPAAVCAGTLVAAYALMTGFGVSAMRACLMFLIWLGAQILGRKRDMLTAAAVAAMLILLQDARLAADSSFLLSFGAVLAIALLVPRLKAANPFSPGRPARLSGKLQPSGKPAGPFRQPQPSGKLAGLFRQPQSSGRPQPFRQPKKRRGGASGGSSGIASAIWQALCPGAGIWLGMLPITLLFFYQSAPWSILVNLAVVPLLSAVLGFGFLSCVVGLFSVPAGTFLAAPVYYLLSLFEGLCRAQQQLPGALWIAGAPAYWKIAAYYAVLAAAAVCASASSCASSGAGASAFPKARAFASSCSAVLRVRRLRPRRVGAGSAAHREREGNRVAAPARQALTWGLAILIGLSLMGIRPRSGLTVMDLDVGQGDGALLQFADGTNCLIDGGSSSKSSVWEYQISRTLKYCGISTLDYVFLSHADSDHINGVEEYLEEYLSGFAGKNAHGISLRHLVLPPVAEEEDFKEMILRADELGIPILRMSAGASVKTKTWSLDCLAPDGKALAGEKNEDSMVLLLRYGAFRMLFTGDLENEAEKRLAASAADLSCDVLKVGHHGSKNSSSEEFLEAASPAVGVISCAEHNSYGHPSPEAIRRLTEAGVRLYATKDCGAILIHTDGEHYSIEGYRKSGCRETE